MAQRQRARYRVARYVIVNNVTTATLDSKGISNSFKDGSSKLNNHSAMAVGKFILALSVQFEILFCFTAVCP